MKIFLDVDSSTNTVRGWGSSPININPIEIEIEDSHEFLKEVRSDLYSLIDGQLIKNDTLVLNKEKEKKINELNTKCEQTILGRFSVELDGGTYEFSYDNQAQSRFNGVAGLFNADLITEIPWTCYFNGERQRILLDKETFNKVALAGLEHCNSNIIKFNDLLFQVTNVVVREELEKIVW